MSACYQNAVEAAREWPGRVFVVDSRSLSTGIGLLVCEAGERVNSGMEAAQIASDLQSLNQFKQA